MWTATATVIVVHSLPISLGDQLPDWNIAARYRGHCTWPTRLIKVELLPPGWFVPRFTFRGKEKRLIY